MNRIMFFAIGMLFTSNIVLSDGLSGMSIDELFDLAVQSQPSEYVEIREALFNKVSDKSSFASMIESQDLIVHKILAEAMLNRYKNPDTYAHYDQLLEYTELVAAGIPGNRGYKSNMFRNITIHAQCHNDGSNWPINKKAYISSILDIPKEEELRFILEKPEFIPFWVESSMKNKSVYQRAYSLVRLSSYNAPVVQKILLEVMCRDENVYIQACAVDLITDPELLPLLYEELAGWETSREKEIRYQKHLEEVEKMNEKLFQETGFPAMEFMTGDEESEKLRHKREKISYFSPLYSAIIRAFNRMDYSESIDLLKEIYSSPDAQGFMRKESLNAFGKFKDPDTLPFLCREFEKHPNAELAGLIGQMDIDTYLNYLQTQNGDARLEVVIGAISLSNPIIIQPLAQIAMNDARSDIRRHAKSQIAYINYKDSIEPFLPLLSKDKSPEVRAAAVTAIGRSGLRDAVPVLVEIFQKDPDQKVHLAVIKGFEHLNYPETVEFLKQYEQQSEKDKELIRQIRNRVEGNIRRAKQR